MQLVDVSSLAMTVDRINQAFFDGQKLSATIRAEAAQFIATRQGLPGCYRGLFAPTAEESSLDLVLFTGERVASWAGRMHILGEESLRALLLLNAASAVVKTASANAQSALGQYLIEPGNRERGMYCCGQCSVSVWRVIAAGGYKAVEGFASRGISLLSERRDRRGRWHAFPFWYTVLALHELDSNEALAELRYCAPALQRSLKRQRQGTVYAQRRHRLAELVLARVWSAV